MWQCWDGRGILTAITDGKTKLGCFDKRRPYKLIVGDLADNLKKLGLVDGIT